jgi:hypothetical protein
MIAKFTQYLRPDGRQVEAEFKVADDLAEQLALIQSAGANLTAEVLMTGIVSFTISDVDSDDFDIELVPNGPEVPLAIDRLIRRFNLASYEQWEKEVAEAEKGGVS